MYSLDKDYKQIACGVWPMRSLVKNEHEHDIPFDAPWLSSPLLYFFAIFDAPHFRHEKSPNMMPLALCFGLPMACPRGARRHDKCHWLITSLRHAYGR